MAGGRGWGRGFVEDDVDGVALEDGHSCPPCQWGEKDGELRAMLLLSIGNTTGVSWLLIAARRRDFDAGLAEAGRCRAR